MHPKQLGAERIGRDTGRSGGVVTIGHIGAMTWPKKRLRDGPTMTGKPSAAIAVNPRSTA